MEIKIELSNTVYDEIETLMHNIKEINMGSEIGGWLLGEYQINDEEKGQITLHINEFIIPKQKVSRTEVDIGPESMIDTIKEIGPEKANKIKGHWHIHPFGKGKTNWSTTDEEKITDFMNPEKGREIFVFLLSSEDTIKGRIELNMQTKISLFNKSMYIKRTIDDIEIHRETEKEQTEIFSKLKERIIAKVEQPKIEYTYYGNSNPSYQTYLKNSGWYGKEDLSETLGTRYDAMYDIRKTKKGFMIKINKELASYIKDTGIGSYELMSIDKTQTEKEDEIWIYKLKHPEQADKIIDIFEEELSQLEEEYATMILTEEKNGIVRGVEYD